MTVRSEPRHRAWGPVWPHGVSEQRTTRGFFARSASQPSPSVASSSGACVSMTTSARATRSSSRSRPRGFVRSSVMPRFEVLYASQTSERSRSSAWPQNGPRRRRGSPAGGSTLMTSAPRSPRSFAAKWPGSLVRSSTRMPSKLPRMELGLLSARRRRCQGVGVGAASLVGGPTCHAMVTRRSKRSHRTAVSCHQLVEEVACGVDARMAAARVALDRHTLAAKRPRPRHRSASTVREIESTLWA